MSGTDEVLSATKISPLDSAMKRHAAHADSHGVCGEDAVIGSSHIEPFSHQDTTNNANYGKDHGRKYAHAHHTQGHTQGAHHTQGHAQPTQGHKAAMVTGEEDRPGKEGNMKGCTTTVI